VSDSCWVPGCKGRIIPSREIRTNVTRAGECADCGTRYQRFGTGEWKFETERADCPKDGCDGFIEFEIRPDRPAEGSCWKCETAYVRQPDGTLNP